MKYKTDIDKKYLDWLIDVFEADMHKTTKETFNKRSSVSMRGGRPYSYSPKEISEQMVIYFRDCVKNSQPFMITGICLQLGISRSGLLNLQKSSKDEFVYTIKRGKDIVELYLEIQGHLLPNPNFPIFLLKNMGWK
jgi:hypothetical protein